jgi:hypothetical protein
MALKEYRTHFIQADGPDKWLELVCNGDKAAKAEVETLVDRQYSVELWSGPNRICSFERKR